MKKWLLKNWKLLVSIIINIILVVFLIVDCSGKKAGVLIIKVPVHDTVTVEKERIIEKTKIVNTYTIDTFYVNVAGDTIELSDIPMEEKIYEDTISNDSTSTELKIKYSGFNASIDSIYLKHNYYNTREIITKEPKKVGLVWFIGPSIGYGVHGSVNTGTFGHGPEIGITAGVGLGGQIQIKKKK